MINEQENDTVLRLSNLYRQENISIDKTDFLENITTKHYTYLPAFLYCWLGWERFNASNGSGWMREDYLSFKNLNRWRFRYDRPYHATASPVYLVAAFVPLLLFMAWGICDLAKTKAELERRIKHQQEQIKILQIIN